MKKDNIRKPKIAKNIRKTGVMLKKPATKNEKSGVTRIVLKDVSDGKSKAALGHQTGISGRRSEHQTIVSGQNKPLK